MRDILVHQHFVVEGEMQHKNWSPILIKIIIGLYNNYSLSLSRMCWKKKENVDIELDWYAGSRFPKETGVDRTRRHCSVETIRGTGPSELGWSRPRSKNPLERAWPQWDQRRLSNRREQILHFDLSRKGREAITMVDLEKPRLETCLYTLLVSEKLWKM